MNRGEKKLLAQLILLVLLGIGLAVGFTYLKAYIYAQAVKAALL